MTADWSPAAGTLAVSPALRRPDLLAEPVLTAVRELAAADSGRVGVAEIDPDVADTTAFCERYRSPLELSANCVVVAGKRAGQVRHAACLVLATTRADVNGAVKRRLDVRKASFVPMAEAVQLTGMAHGGITPLGLPGGWPVLVDPAVAETPSAVIGSGLRGSKLITAGEVLARLPGAEVLPDLAQPVA